MIDATRSITEALPALWRAGLRSVRALALAGGVSAAAAGQAPAVLTLLEGQAKVIVGAQVHTAAPGARLDAGAIVETDADTRLVRLEWPDGSLLDLGPGTQVMLQPPLRGGAAPRQPLFYLLQGWAKQTQPTEVSGQLSPAFDVPPFKGVLVAQVTPKGAVLFAESGTAGLASRLAPALQSLRAGGAAVAGADGRVRVLARPPADWLKRIPRAFRDTLPARASRFQGPPPVLAPRPAATYESLQHWLVAEPDLRHDFPDRFAPLLSDRTFRGAVQKQLRQHPEWRAALRPARPASTVAR